MTAFDLENCANIDRSQTKRNVTLTRSPYKVLRLLRGRACILDPSARATLNQWSLELWRFDPIEQATLIEIGLEIDPNTYDGAAEQLFRIVHDAIEAAPKDPSALFFPVFVLLSHSWRTP